MTSDSCMSVSRYGRVNEMSEKSSPSKNVTSEQISSRRTWKRVNGRPCRNLPTSSVVPCAYIGSLATPFAMFRHPLRGCRRLSGRSVSPYLTAKSSCRRGVDSHRLQVALHVARGLPQALLVLHQGDAHEALAVLAVADARGDRDVG